MKVLLVNSLYYPNIVGGAEISVQKLAEGLVKKGYDVSVLTLGNNDELNLINGVRVFSLKERSPFKRYPEYSKMNKIKYKVWKILDLFNVFSICSILRVLAHIKPNVVHTNNISGFSVILWVCCKIKNIKIVHTTRDFYLMCMNSAMYKKQNCNKICTQCKRYSMLKKYSTRLVDHYVGISNFISEKHIQNGYFTYARKSIINNSVDVHNDIVEVIDKKKDRKENLVNVGFVGRVEYKKGILDLVNAIEFLISKNYKIQLHVFGKCNDELLKKRLLNESFINYHAFVSIPSDIYNKIDFLVVPSKWNEPFGRVIIESFSYGKPVITSSNGGMPELIDIGNNGYIYSKQSQLIDAIELMINNGVVFERFNLEKFTDSYVVDRYIEIYEQ